jgi:site-specific DNA-adenine methylase
MTPFVKWVGGKRQLINNIKELMPRNYEQYFEPFIGGGAVLFEITPKNAIISDMNKELITTYKVFKSRILFNQLMQRLDEYEKNHSETLRDGARIHKKTHRLSSETGTNKQKYQVVKELRRKYTLKDLLEISGLPKSVYYYYEHYKRTDKYHEIKILILEIFEASNKTYGYRRIKLALQNIYQIKIAYKTVVKLMKELHIVCKVRKRRYRYISQISNKITPNLLKRDFKKDDPNIAWVTDVSEFRFNRKRLYLSVIQDLYNGEVKGYQFSRSQNQDLILKTLKKAINQMRIYPSYSYILIKVFYINLQNIEIT